MVEKKGVDMAEILDEIVQQDRYGKRNYRNSIGADNRRHWRGGSFLVTEESVDAEVDEDKLADFMDKNFEGETDTNTEDAAGFVPDTPEAAPSNATYNITDDHVSAPAVEPNAEQDPVSGFSDPLDNVADIDKILEESGLAPDVQDEKLYGTEALTDAESSPADQEEEQLHGTEASNEDETDDEQITADAVDGYDRRPNDGQEEGELNAW